MTQPSAAETRPTPKQLTVPPDERFWKRYSPHHEFPFSTVGAIVLHALAVVLIVAIAANWRAHQDEQRPVEMQIVEIMGGEGLGLDGLGTGTTLLGGTKRSKTDADGPADGGDPLSKPAPKDQPQVALRDPVRPPDLKFTPRKDGEPIDDGVITQLDQTVKRVEEGIQLAMAPKPQAGGKKSGTATKNYPNPRPGTGGPAGKGTGKGVGVGPGGGTSPFGQVLTTQKRRQLRWQILASMDGKIHLAKLQALNVTLVVPTGNANVYNVYELKPGHVSPQTATRLEKHGDKVWWTNRDPSEVQPLARELGLRTIPACFVIFLPKALEQRMAELEVAHQNAREDQIAKTIWDVPLRDGHYAREPVIVEQHLYPGARGVRR